MRGGASLGSSAPGARPPSAVAASVRRCSLPSTATKTDRADTIAILEAARNEAIDAVPVKTLEQTGVDVAAPVALGLRGRSHGTHQHREGHPKRVWARDSSGSSFVRRPREGSRSPTERSTKTYGSSSFGRSMRSSFQGQDPRHHESDRDDRHKHACGSASAHRARNRHPERDGAGRIRGRAAPLPIGSTLRILAGPHAARVVLRLEASARPHLEARHYIPADAAHARSSLSLVGCAPRLGARLPATMGPPCRIPRRP